MRFEYTWSVKDKVTKALGSGYDYNSNSDEPYWVNQDRTIAVCVEHDEIQELDLHGNLSATLGPAYLSVQGFPDVAKEASYFYALLHGMHDAEQRLRAAGLKLVKP